MDAPCFLFYTVPGAIRTRGLSLRRRTLYPAELQKQIVNIFNCIINLMKCNRKEKMTGLHKIIKDLAIGNKVCIEAASFTRCILSDFMFHVKHEVRNMIKCLLLLSLSDTMYETAQAASDSSLAANDIDSGKVLQREMRKMR